LSLSSSTTFVLSDPTVGFSKSVMKVEAFHNLSTGQEELTKKLKS